CHTMYLLFAFELYGYHRDLHSLPTRRSSDLIFWLTRPATIIRSACRGVAENRSIPNRAMSKRGPAVAIISMAQHARPNVAGHSRSEEHTSELQSRDNLVCRLLPVKKMGRGSR